MKKWHKVDCPATHLGSGGKHNMIIYIYARDIKGVLNTYRRMPGLKRDISGAKIFPSIRELSEEESNELERRILNQKNINLKKAKARYFIDDRYWIS